MRRLWLLTSTGLALAAACSSFTADAPMDGPDAATPDGAIAPDVDATGPDEDAGCVGIACFPAEPCTGDASCDDFESYGSVEIRALVRSKGRRGRRLLSYVTACEDDPAPCKAFSIPPLPIANGYHRYKT